MPKNKEVMFRNDANGGLIARIEGKELVIRIGLGRLRWCMEHDDGPMRGCRFKTRAFTKDMMSEMAREDGDGYTELCKFLDRMAYKAYEMGSVNIKMKDDDED
jgi:hypothetical protein